MHILIADDHALLRDGIRLLLKELGDVVISEARNSTEIDVFLSNPDAIDLLLLDLDMPGMNHTDGVQHVCAQAPSTAVVVISGSDTVYTIEACLKAGALGFISKASSNDVILNAIRMVLSGERYVPAKALEGLINTSGNKRLPISPRQQEIWFQLAEGKSNKEIANALGLSDSTVKQHVSGLFRKLGINSRAQAIQKAHGKKGT